MLQQIHGDELMPVSAAMPDDVVRLYEVLHSGQQTGQIDLGNNGTAMRFLTAYFAQLPGALVTLTGCARMCERPIGPLVNALREMGATITYLGQEGFPPIRIEGRALKRCTVAMEQVVSTQFVSALLLIGGKVRTDSVSPYIYMTRAMVENYPNVRMEKDWSAAAFWYEYAALHPCQLQLEGLSPDSLQGDKIVADVFAPLGVETLSRENGIEVSSLHRPTNLPSRIEQDFRSCPDLYPALALACEGLHIELMASGVENLRYKESDRLESVAKHQVMADHRMAMALLAADYGVEDTRCIDKSYPQFYEQLCVLRQSLRGKASTMTT